jgi:hypothetical protein
MGYAFKTVLGRLVASEIEVEKDFILKILYNSHYDFWDTDDTPMSLDLLSQSLGKGQKRTKDICEILIKENLVEKMPVPFGSFYKIAPMGIEFVEKAKSQI